MAAQNHDRTMSWGGAFILSALHGLHYHSTTTVDHVSTMFLAAAAPTNILEIHISASRKPHPKRDISLCRRSRTAAFVRLKSLGLESCTTVLSNECHYPITVIVQFSVFIWSPCDESILEVY